MNRRFFTFVIAAVLLSAQLATSAESARVVILVRHAERASTLPDSLLSDVGHRRAACLARTLADTGIQAILTSDVKRTQETAQPLADRLHIHLTILKADDINGFVKQLQTAPAGAQLVVAHSDTLPQIVAGLGADAITPFGRDEYDRMLVLTVLGPHEAMLTTLRYCPSDQPSGDKP